MQSSATVERFRVGKVRSPDPDYRDIEKRTVTLPSSWWDRLDAAAKRAEGGFCDRFDATIQLVRLSLNEPGPAPQPEGPDMEGDRRASSVSLSRRLWGLIDAEAGRRGLSMNRMVQCHILRGLKLEEADAPPPAPAPRRSKRQ